MLKDLITSRVRVKLLTLLLSNPDKIFHVREIVRQIKEEINAVRRELKHLEDKGYVSKEPRANRLYYTFRKNHPSDKTAKMAPYFLMFILGNTPFSFAILTDSS